jgi:hypothetical protein
LQYVYPLLLAGCSVDTFAEQIGVAEMPAVFLDQM